MDIKKIFLASLLTILLQLKLVYSQERKDEAFYVKPGAGTLSVEHEVNQYKCKFTYAAQGGTHEEWAFSVEIIDGGSAVMCVVERAGSSYLFFENFKLELIGPLVTITDTEIKGSGKRDLHSSEYIHEKNEVASSSKFKNQLEKAVVYSSLPKVDL